MAKKPSQRGAGSLYWRGKTIWVKYYRNGVPVRESAETDKEGVARAFLRRRLGDIERGAPIAPRADRLRFDEAAADLLTEYRVNGRKSIEWVDRRLRLHLTPHFGGRRMVSITTPDVRAYIDKRQGESVRIRKATDAQLEVRRPVSVAEINRELAILKRMFVLAMQAGKLLHRPHIPMLTERNTRSGFFEREEFEAVRAALPADLRPVMTFAYITGWRTMSEVLPLTWARVDLDAGTVRLEPGTTKNSEGRLFPADEITELIQVLLKTSGRTRTPFSGSVTRSSRGSSTARAGGSRALGRLGSSPVRRRATPRGFRMTSDAPPCGTWSGLVCRSRRRCS